MKLLRKNKKEFYNNTTVKYITKNKLFWKTVKPSFTDKPLKDERINLFENNKFVSDEIKLVEIFSKYFGNIVQNLGIDGLTNIFLLAMIENLQKSIDSWDISDALLTDPSKAFDCLPHDLFIAKLYAHSTKEGSLNLFISYLINRKKSVRLNNTWFKNLKCCN